MKPINLIDKYYQNKKNKEERTMLKNMKVKMSLILGLSAAILVSVAIIVASLIIMTNQAQSYQDIINTDIRSSTLVRTCRLEVNIAARCLRDVALDPDSETVGDNTTKMDNALNNLTPYIQELKTLNVLGDSTSIDNYISAVTEWGTVVPVIREKALGGQQEEAISMLQNECTPALAEVDTAAAALQSEITDHQEEVLEQQETIVTVSIFVIVGVLVLTVLLLFFLNLRIIRNITKPVEEVRTALVGYSQGKLDIPVTFESKNELGEMCASLRISQDVLSDVIKDICYLLEEMANGNFNVRSRATDKYVGALSNVLTSVREINHNLSDTLMQIAQSSEQVSAGADQVSTGAQALAQGATEQASAVEQLSATINEISTNAQKNAKSSAQSLQDSLDAGDQVKKSAQHMEEMAHAMNKISKSSEEIGKIIATIEDIAFQTNILALNAAVEAARAGTAGKGFAVVADEVRNLASKSDQAAKATKELIENSVTSVREGNEIASRVSDALNQTMALAGKAMDGTREIVEAVEGEAESISQVTEGIDQISSVVQTNSATSEESAAASEQLSSQASLMKELLRKFKLRTDGAQSSSSFGAPAEDYSYGGASMPEDNSYGGNDNGISSFSKY